jgi:GT2 family glycosyltransferase
VAHVLLEVVFLRIKSFDDEFFAHQEEIDLCWRALNKGYKIKYISESVVYHVGEQLCNKENQNILNFRNSLLMLTKIPENKLYPILLGRMVLDGIAGMQFL